MRHLPLILSLALFPLVSQATDPETQALVDELRQLSEQARQQRAADRWLQQALDDLVARYDWPWRNELVYDDFADGDYEQNPAWEVLRGRFWVSRERGLRSRAEPARAEESGEQPSVEAAILGALLDQALGPRDDSGSGLDIGGEPSQIRLNAAISNAFALEAEFSLETPEGPGRLAFSLLQGSSGDYGYRLRLQSGADGHVELERLRRGLAGVVESVRLPIDPGDGGRHQLAWRQTPDGDVTVELDGQPLFQVRDKAFRDGYQQLILSHWSGDLTLHSIRVSGT